MPRWWSDVPDPIVPLGEPWWKDATPYVIAILVCLSLLLTSRWWLWL